MCTLTQPAKHPGLLLHSGLGGSFSKLVTLAKKN